MPLAIYSSAGFQIDVATETAFGSGTVLADLGALGIGAKFTSYELDSAWTEIYEIGQRAPQGFYSAGLKAPTSIDFLMCQDQVGWLAFVLGAAAGGTYTVGNTIQTGQVKLGTAQGNTFTVGGIVFTSAKIGITQGSAVSVSLQGTGATFTEGAATISPGAIPSQLLTWKDCSISGTTMANLLVQELDLTINTGAKQFYTLGSAQYQTYLPLESEIQCSIKPFHDDTNFDSIYSAVDGDSYAQGGTITVSIGTHTVSLNGTYFTSRTMDLEPVKETMDDITFYAKNLTFV